MAADVDDDYAPDKIEYYLAHWAELQEAAEGGTGSLGGQGGGRGDRLALACLLADLERAADELPVHWSATRKIYLLQARRPRAHLPGGLRPSEEVSVQTAARYMARALGWSE